MAFLSDETQGFRNFFSVAQPDRVAALYPGCLTEVRTVLVRATASDTFYPDTGRPTPSVCVVEAATQQQKVGKVKEEASTSFFDGREYVCSRASFNDDQRAILDRLTGQTITLYLVCVRAQEVRSYYQAQADVAASTPSSYHFTLHYTASLAPAAGTVVPGFTPMKSGSPAVAAPYPPNTGPYGQSQQAAVAGVAVHINGTTPARTTPTVASDDQCCSSTWAFFGLGFLFPILWIVGAVMGTCCARPDATKAERRGGMACLIALLVWIPLVITLYAVYFANN